MTEPERRAALALGGCTQIVDYTRGPPMPPVAIAECPDCGGRWWLAPVHARGCWVLDAILNLS